MCRDNVVAFAPAAALLRGPGDVFPRIRLQRQDGLEVQPALWAIVRRTLSINRMNCKIEADGRPSTSLKVNPTRPGQIVRRLSTG